MRNLVISEDTYSWIKYCSGIILEDPKSFSVMIVCADDERHIIGCTKGLCRDATYVQRAYDTRNIGKEIGLKRVSNLLYDAVGENIQGLTTQLQLSIMIGGIANIYFQNNDILSFLIFGT